MRPPPRGCWAAAIPRAVRLRSAGPMLRARAATGMGLDRRTQRRVARSAAATPPAGGAPARSESAPRQPDDAQPAGGGRCGDQGGAAGVRAAASPPTCASSAMRRSHPLAARNRGGAAITGAWSVQLPASSSSSTTRLWITAGALLADSGQMTIVTLVSSCGNAYPGDGTRDGGGQGGRWVSSTPTAGG